MEEIATDSMPDSEHWTLEIVDHVGVLTFARPPANWMSLQAMTELADWLEHLASRTAEITVVMLTGGVDGYFVAHADLDDLALMAAGQIPAGDPNAWRRVFDRLDAMPQPVVAAIDGQAHGGGNEIAMGATLRIASQRSHFRQGEIEVGIIPGAGGTQRLPRLVGASIGFELCLSGRRIEADEAHRIGLLSDVLPTADFRQHAIDWCGRIAAHSPAAVFACKRALVDGAKLPLVDGLKTEWRLFRDLNASDDARARNAAVDRPDHRDDRPSR